jgi:DNA-binding transcriptional MerR regulator/methylmalonyl-CoA mutase cobalamin-binding subunit
MNENKMASDKSSQKESEPIHPIRYVVKRTGLSSHVIRIWEKRYDAVTPKRSDTNRRLYSDHDVERLNLLRQATEAGESIGQIAHLPTDVLREMVGEQNLPVFYTSYEKIAEETAAEDFLDACKESVRNLDHHALENQLAQATLQHNQMVVMKHIVLPLITWLGDGWQSGFLRIAHEHMASAVLRTFLGSMLESAANDQQNPLILCTTPSGQQHELGAMMAAVAAVNEGWRVLYLGPDMPAEEIAGTAISQKARAVALSLMYPANDPRIAQELIRLKRLLPPEIAIVAGGRALTSYAHVLERINAFSHDHLDHFRFTLQHLASGAI